MPDKVKIVVENTNTKFYVWENDSWVLGGTEYVYLYDGTTKMLASSRNVSSFTSGNITKIVRTATWKQNISTIDTYVFDSTIDDVELFPISHEFVCVNCVGKIVQFEYRDLLYEGETREASSPESFGHNMKVEWENNNYYAKIFQQIVTDKLIIKYKPVSDYSVYSVRLFDPDPFIDIDTNITFNNVSGNRTYEYGTTASVVTSIGYSYQEDANETEILVAGLSSNFTDGDWNTGENFSLNVDVGGNFYYIFNYSVPAGATGAEIIVKDSLGTKNISVPSSCFDDKVIVQYESVDLPNQYNIWCGSGQNVGLYNTSLLYEEGMYWIYDTDECVDVYLLGYGLHYMCGSNLDFNITFSNYTFIDYFSDLTRYASLFFRVSDIDAFYVSIPSFVDDVIGASFSISGGLSSDISGFDDWDYEDTSKSYYIVNGSNYIFNVSLMNNKVFKSANFIVQSSNVSFVNIDICNDGSYDFNKTGSFISPTSISLPYSFLNNCSNVNYSSDISVVPIKMNFTYGSGNVIFSDVDFRFTTKSYPKDIKIDVNNDSYDDFILSGELDGDTGVINIFNDDSSYVDIVSAGYISEIVNISVSNNIVYDDFSFYISSVSSNDEFTEDFSDNDYMNTSSTVVVDNFWGMISNNVVGGIPVESYYYSLAIPTYKDVGYVYNTISDSVSGSSSNTYYFSSNCGENWTILNENTLTNIDVPGNCSMWKVKMSTDGANYNYVYSVNIRGLGYTPTNIVIDVGSDGNDYELDSLEESTLVNISSSVINSYISNCTSSICVVPVNVTFSSAGTLRLNNLALSYSTNNISVNSKVIKSGIKDHKTNSTIVSEFNDSSTTKVFNNSVVAYISIPNDVIVKSANVTIKGDYS